MAPSLARRADQRVDGFTAPTCFGGSSGGTVALSSDRTSVSTRPLTLLSFPKQLADRFRFSETAWSPRLSFPQTRERLRFQKPERLPSEKKTRVRASVRLLRHDSARGHNREPLIPVLCFRESEVRLPREPQSMPSSQEPLARWAHVAGHLGAFVAMPCSRKVGRQSQLSTSPRPSSLLVPRSSRGSGRSDPIHR